MHLFQFLFSFGVVLDPILKFLFSFFPVCQITVKHLSNLNQYAKIETEVKLSLPKICHKIV